MKKTYISPNSCAIDIYTESHILTDSIGIEDGNVDDSDKSNRMDIPWSNDWSDGESAE